MVSSSVQVGLLLIEIGTSYVALWEAVRHVTTNEGFC